MRPSNINVKFKVYNKADTVNGQVLAVTRSWQYEIFFHFYLQSPKKPVGWTITKVRAIFCSSQQRGKKVQILIFVLFAKTQMINLLEKPKYLRYKIS